MDGEVDAGEFECCSELTVKAMLEWFIVTSMKNSSFAYLLQFCGCI